MRNSLLIIIIVLLGGCFPINKTIQPETRVLVTDVNGNPLHGAEVNLYSVANPYSRLENHVIGYTTESGSVRFGEIDEWRIESFVIHGMDIIHWDTCVSKEGYKTEVVEWQNIWEVGGNVSLVMQKGESVPCEPPGIVSEKL
ncbi:hypothetical protein [Hahella ganghwensis]|uniref:hypothetical protein n=1 Tax=Hahella ganghwensis TaxID=286420 RepID=UPI000379A41F|nr:hypothetical protein [Hahella ganghwensis]